MLQNVVLSDYFARMANSYGLVLAAIVPFFISILSIAIFQKRNHPFIKSRQPDFILVQNAGVAFNFIVIALYIGLRPNFPCQLNMLSVVLYVSVVGWVLLVRMFQYCLDFYIAEWKANCRTYGFEVTTSYISKCTRIAKPDFVRKVYGVGCLVFAIPGIYYVSTNENKYSEIANTCQSPRAFTTLYTCFSAILAGLGIFFAFLIRNSRDAYRLRWEKIVISLVWLCEIIATYLVYYVVPPSAQKIFPPVFCQIFAEFVTLCICNLVPLYYAQQIDKLQPSKETFEDFVYLIKFPSFRNAFYDFLAQQFCGENLQFYEAVQVWKPLLKDDVRRKNALQISELFLVENGPCQVHLLPEIKTQIQEKLHSTYLPPDMFDEACESLLHDMYLHSFLLFRITREFTESQYVELI
eukprot:Phypoly_transcript_09726.p1 GENE.Phypoly_transcript_09726~~Phypoly_transcript_09726.p1  ORF type:complete len:409 (+),score=40.81 Phypoly_transcript_09726:102-1328(+)